jgi:hypothetical protein
MPAVRPHPWRPCPVSSSFCGIVPGDTAIRSASAASLEAFVPTCTRPAPPVKPLAALPCLSQPMEGLRVIDEPVMPRISAGYSDAPAVMIDDNGAAVLREDAHG